MTQKLSDMQLVLLATACQREDGSILPPPERLGDQAARIRKAIPPLLKRRLIEEVGVSDPTRVWREEGDTFLGLAITEAGRTLIAAEEPAAPVASAAPVALTAPVASDVPTTPVALIVSAEPAVPVTKIGTVIGMLRREDGATLAELVAATDWLPHSIRAALTGLRKKGHAIDKATRDGATVYMIAAA